ncbi:hypothetical protein Acsp03_61990 [Actinomadura sp. NBRC 104412]|nr:hypothetical protein Acsp03_61990 [Actinomadura sp. NBRC 104412]
MPCLMTRPATGRVIGCTAVISWQALRREVGMTHQIAPDTAKPSGVTPTQFHCYRYSAAGQEWDRAMKRDMLDCTRRTGRSTG